MSKEEKSPVLDLVDIADACFSRAAELEEGGAFKKKDEEVLKFVEDLRNDSLRECITLWKTINRLISTSSLEQAARKELQQDASKVISRCYQHLGNLEKARKHIARAIDEGYLGGFISLGAICMKLEDYAAAEEAFNSALSKGVMETRAHAGLGELYFAIGIEELKKDSNHTEFFIKAEKEFILAGKAKFTQGFDRAIDLFDMIGLKGRALSVGESAVSFYEQNKSVYGEKLRALDSRLRKITGDDKHDKMVKELGNKIKKLLDNK